MGGIFDWQTPGITTSQSFGEGRLRSTTGIRKLQATKALRKAGVAGVAGLEPVTSAVTGQRSNQLSYTPSQERAKGSVPRCPSQLHFRIFYKKGDPGSRRQGGGGGEPR